jgi:CubicO group peptidase (beta-lactamase class C family)
VFIDGALAVEACAGVIGPASSDKVHRQTLFNMSSCGKGVAATCVHLLAERGSIDYEDPVARYWPEFGVHGKDRITVRQVLGHRSGIPQTPENYTPALLTDWEAMCAGIAQLRPQFAPGTRTGYQAITFGFIVGELLRRVDGRPIAQFLRDEICVPLHAESIYFGVPDEALSRVATISDDGIPGRAGRPAPIVTADVFNRREIRQASVSSNGAIGTARSLATHYAMLAEGGTLNGVRLLSPERIRLASRLYTADEDVNYHAVIRRGLGYRLGKDTGPGAEDLAFGHVGDGMYGYADPARHFAIAYLQNYVGRPAPPNPGSEVYSLVAAELGLSDSD